MAGRSKGLESVQATATAGPWVESQARLSRVLRAEIEQTAQGQATIADAKSGAATGESNDE